MKKRYFLEIAFDGTNYFGWQVQPNKKTVQQTIQEIVSKLFNEEIKIVGCGRTDSGVHAKQYFLHFDTTNKRTKIIDSLKLMFPNDIQLINVYEVDNEAHARFDATERSYSYYLHHKKDIFKRYFSLDEDLQVLDEKAIKQACKLFTKESNYKHLSKNNKQIDNYISKVSKAEWIFSEDKTQAVFHVTANRFLHNQIRRMLGVLLNIGKGKIYLKELENAFQKDIPLKINDSVLPKALFLHSIKYPFI